MYNLFFSSLGIFECLLSRINLCLSCSLILLSGKLVWLIHTFVCQIRATYMLNKGFAKCFPSYVHKYKCMKLIGFIAFILKTKTLKIQKTVKNIYLNVFEGKVKVRERFNFLFFFFISKASRWSIHSQRLFPPVVFHCTFCSPAKHVNKSNKFWSFFSKQQCHIFQK